MISLVLLCIGLYLGFTTGDWVGILCLAVAALIALAWGYISIRLRFPKHIALWVDTYVIGIGMKIGIIVLFVSRYS